MDTGNYKKTELKIVSVNDLDGDIQAEIPDRNFLREKTFNSELNSLVNKIYNNEIMSSEPSVTNDEPDALEKTNLLIECEKLIYRLKHHEEINSVTSVYNPFDTDINVYDDIDDTADYIKAGMTQCGYPQYQILRYSFNDKAFRSDINFLDQSYSSDMYFSINDPLIHKLKEIKDGIVLKSDVIESDPFFHKKFLNNDADDVTPHSFYITGISSLFADSMNVRTFSSRISKFEWFLSPILIVKLEDKETPDTAGIHSSLRQTAALPLMLYFMKNRIKFNINKYSYEDTLLMIELFIRSSLNSRLKSYLITLDDYSTKDNIFIFKFLLSKIRRILKSNSVVLRVNVNQAVIITPQAEISDIDNVIDRVNSEMEIIRMHPVDYNEFLNSREFVSLFL